MLAQSISHHHHDLSSNRMTTSLVVTPPLRTQPSLPPSSNPTTHSRPKLSLNTSQARTFGKGSSLRLETLSAVSPTAINTFANGYEPERAQTAPAGRPARPRLCIDSSVQSTSDSDDVEVLDSRTPSSSSVSSASTLNSATIPYSISQVLHSVLANSPLQPRANIRRMSIRPRFPAEKKVSFRTPLEEEVVNTRFTLAHSDISDVYSSDTGSSVSLSPEEEEAAQTSSSSSQSSTTNTHTESTLSLEQPTDDSSRSPSFVSPVQLSSPLRRRRLHPRVRPKKDSPQVGDKRDSSSESDSDACPETPVAGRRKRRREWVWTLGSLPGQSNTSVASQDSTSTTTTMSTDSTFSTTSTSASDQSS